jgi:hypothetical protein
VLIHVDTEKSELPVDSRFAYAVSRAQHYAHIYTNDGSRLSCSLSRESSQRTATEVQQELAAPKAEPVIHPHMILPCAFEQHMAGMHGADAPKIASIARSC